MKKLTLLILLLSLLTFDTCKKSDLPSSVIDPDFQIYVDHFVTEASLRGIGIDVNGLKVSFSDTTESYCGLGNPMDVKINPNCWKNWNDTQKEIFLFHELGHAVFGHAHDNSKLPNGDFKSIMCSETSYLIELYNNAPEKREYYLDQLFNLSTPEPSWSAIKSKPTIVFKDTITAGSNSWEYVNGPDNNFKGEFCSSVFYSNGTSLSIKSSDVLKGYSFWTYDYFPQGINQSDRLVLSAQINLDAVKKGGGVTLLMSGFNENDERVFFTFKTDSGTMDFTEWKADVPYYVLAKKIRIRMVLDRSAGIAFFDDITLTKYE